MDEDREPVGDVHLLTGPQAALLQERIADAIAAAAPGAGSPYDRDEMSGVSADCDLLELVFTVQRFLALHPMSGCDVDCAIKEGIGDIPLRDHVRGCRACRDAVQDLIDCHAIQSEMVLRRAGAMACNDRAALGSVPDTKDGLPSVRTWANRQREAPGSRGLMIRNWAMAGGGWRRTTHLAGRGTNAMGKIALNASRLISRLRARLLRSLTLTLDVPVTSVSVMNAGDDGVVWFVLADDAGAQAHQGSWCTAPPEGRLQPRVSSRQEVSMLLEILHRWGEDQSSLAVERRALCRNHLRAAGFEARATRLGIQMIDRASGRARIALRPREWVLQRRLAPCELRAVVGLADHRGLPRQTLWTLPDILVRASTPCYAVWSVPSQRRLHSHLLCAVPRACRWLVERSGAVSRALSSILVRWSLAVRRTFRGMAKAAARKDGGAGRSMALRSAPDSPLGASVCESGTQVDAVIYGHGAARQPWEMVGEGLTAGAPTPRAAPAARHEPASNVAPGSHAAIARTSSHCGLDGAVQLLAAGGVKHHLGAAPVASATNDPDL